MPCRATRLARGQGRVELFRPPLNQAYKISGDRYINEAYEFQLSDNGWGGYAGDLVVHEVPGDHDSMVLEPNVRVRRSTCRRGVRAGGVGRTLDGLNRSRVARRFRSAAPAHLHGRCCR